MKPLGENDLVEWKRGQAPSVFRLLWMDPNAGHYYFISAEGDKGWTFHHSKDEVSFAMENGDLQVIADYIRARLIHEKDLPDDSKIRMNETYEMVQWLVEDKEKIFSRQHCGKLVKAASEKFNSDRATVYKQLRRFWQRGQCRLAVQPDYCGERGGRYLDPEDPDFEKKKARKRGRPRTISPGKGANITLTDVSNFKDFIQTRYLKQNRPPLKLVWMDMMRERYDLASITSPTDVEEMALKKGFPTFGQFRYFYRTNYRLDDTLKAREGELTFLRKHRPTLGDQTKQALYPGALYQIDATTADICLVHSVDKTVAIGRPILYLVVDTLTTLITGFHVTFQNPSYNAAAMALWNAYCDKVEYCKKLDVDIQPDDWPSYGLPTNVLADGGEMKTHVSDGLIEGLGVGIANTAPYRAEAKGIIERMFRQLNDVLISWLRGAKPDGDDPSRADYRKLARLPVDTFMKSLVDAIVTYNKSYKEDYWLDEEMLEYRVKLRPVALWEWGMKHLTGMMKHMPAECVRVGLMPSRTAMVTPDGIRLGDLYYHCPPKVESEWLTRARNIANWPIDVSYDPNCVDYVFLPGKRPQDFQACRLTDKCWRGHSGRSWVEFTAWREDQKRNKGLELLMDLKLRAEARERIARIQNEAIAATEAALDGKVLDVKSIKQNRADEQRREQKLMAQEAKDILKLNGIEHVTKDGQATTENLSKGEEDLFEALDS